MTNSCAKRKNSAIGIRSFGAYFPSRELLRLEITKAHTWALLSLRGLELSHNLGGAPYNGACAISIVGLEGA